MSTLLDASKKLHSHVSAVNGTDRSMGALLIDSGKLQATDAEHVLRYAQEKNLRFGDAAVALRLVTMEDVQQVLAQQFSYPYFLPGESAVSQEVSAAWLPFSKKVEALRALRSQLLLRWFTGEAERKCLSIVSASSGDGKSHLAANMAVVFSQLGERTLLVDANLRSPRQHALFALSNGQGFSSVLAERAGLEAIQRVPAFVDLSVLPAGPTPPNPLELLGRDAHTKLVDTLRTKFDVIIFDTPPASLGTDFQLTCQKSRGALLIARRDHTRAAQCTDMVDAVQASSAVIVGTVLTSF